MNSSRPARSIEFTEEQVRDTRMHAVASRLGVSVDELLARLEEDAERLEATRAAGHDLKMREAVVELLSGWTGDDADAMAYRVLWALAFHKALGDDETRAWKADFDADGEPFVNAPDALRTGVASALTRAHDRSSHDGAKILRAAVRALPGTNAKTADAVTEYMRGRRRK